jgi:hypothetical protein
MLILIIRIVILDLDMLIFIIRISIPDLGIAIPSPWIVIPGLRITLSDSGVRISIGWRQRAGQKSLLDVLRLVHAGALA